VVLAVWQAAASIAGWLEERNSWSRWETEGRCCTLAAAARRRGATVIEARLRNDRLGTDWDPPAEPPRPTNRHDYLLPIAAAVQPRLVAGGWSSVNLLKSRLASLPLRAAISNGSTRTARIAPRQRAASGGRTAAAAAAISFHKHLLSAGSAAHQRPIHLVQNDLFYSSRHCATTSHPRSLVSIGKRLFCHIDRSVFVDRINYRISPTYAFRLRRRSSTTEHRTEFIHVVILYNIIVCYYTDESQANFLK